ncbi:zinc ribbon domain-containing protein [Pseudonocardia sp. NPDC049154]|uniref:FmdB family zinc ribbon protein n=1 Tax=Pseudonocardia sp. NPDC049154 TaxID=3155501 RepID=UPI0033CC84E2
MPLYDYVCPCGVRFELLVPSWSSPAPDCPQCGATTVRRPPSPKILGSAKAPTAMSAAPQSWEGVGSGDRDTITRWRREMDRRQEFESRHPEHREHREAVASHEGVFEGRPLTYQELAARSATSKDANQGVAQASHERRSAETPAG